MNLAGIIDTGKGIDEVIAAGRKIHAVYSRTLGQLFLTIPIEAYIKKVPLDPWGNPYIYLSPGANGDFDLISYGPDGESGGEGENADIESWNID